MQRPAEKATIRKPFLGVAVLLLAIPSARAAGGDESFSALKTEYRAAIKQRNQEFNVAYETARKKGEAALKAFRFDKPSLGTVYSPRFLAIAEKNPEGPDALDALQMTLDTSNDADGKPLETRARAIKILRHHYVTSPRVKTAILRRLAAYKDTEARAFLEDVIDRNPDRKIQMSACQAILNFVEAKATYGNRLKEDKKLRAHHEKTRGTAFVAERIAGAEQARRDADKFGRILREKYADVVADLSVGSPMPAIVSEDLGGKTVTLEELKGKVVVLDIWTTWCGPCKAMIPHEREMIERLKDKPFVLVSISFDEKKKTLTDFLAKQKMPWTHWWNGVEGKLIDTLNIEHYPTVFVLDADGVIRFKEIRGEELEKAVNTLLEEAKNKPAKAA